MGAGKAFARAQRHGGLCLGMGGVRPALALCKPQAAARAAEKRRTLPLITCAVLMALSDLGHAATGGSEISCGAEVLKTRSSSLLSLARSLGPLGAE